MQAPRSIPVPFNSLDADALLDALFDPPNDLEPAEASPQPDQANPSPRSETVFKVR